jgi:hypothetical protein
MGHFKMGSVNDQTPFTRTPSHIQYPVSSYCVEEVLMQQDDGNPDFWALIILVLSAVLEVVVVSLPGYILARMGKFDPETQKFVSGLNMMIFTPCLSTWPRTAQYMCNANLGSLYQNCFATQSR